MGLLQDVLFGDYIARKRREHAVAGAEAMRPEQEFKADVERRLAEAKVRAAEESDIRRQAALEAMRRAGIPLDVEADINTINKYGTNPNFSGTSYGRNVAANRAGSAGSAEREAYFKGYGQNAERRGARTSALEDLTNAGTYLEQLGQQPMRFDLGAAKGQAAIDSAEAASAEANKTKVTAPSAAAAQVATDTERTTNAHVAGAAERARLDAARLQAELEGQIGRYDINELLPGMLRTRAANNQFNNLMTDAKVEAAKSVLPNLSQVDKAALLAPRGSVEQGTYVPGLNYPGPSEDLVTVIDPITKLPKQIPIRKGGTPVSTLRQRVLNPDNGNSAPPPALNWGGRPPMGIGKLPVEGLGEAKPAPSVVKPTVETVDSLQKKEELRLSDVSNWKKSDWLRLAKKSYGLGNIIEVHPDDVINKLKVAMAKEISTGRDFATGLPIPAEILAQVKQQFEQLQKVR